MKRKSDVKDDAGGTTEMKFVRSFEHVDGNWPSHVYLAGKYGTLKELSHLCLQHYEVSTPEPLPVIAIETPHLSLSKPFVLRFHQITPFLKALSERIRHIESFAVRVASKYRLLVNENQTRRFIALDVEDNHGHVAGLVNHVSSALQLFQQPAYYEDPVFHISIASMLLKAPPTDSTQLNTSMSSDEERGSVGMDMAATHSSTVCIVTKPFLNGHATSNTKNSTYQLAGPLGDESDASDEDSVPTWQRCIVPSAPHNPSASICTEACMPSAATEADAKSSTFGLFGDYGSDNDDISAPPSNAAVSANECSNSYHNDASAAVPAITKLLRFTAVECKIGNRLYRLDMRNNMDVVGASGATLPNFDIFHDKDSFYEVK